MARQGAAAAALARPIRLDCLHAAGQELLRQLKGPLGQQRHRHLAIGAVVTTARPATGARVKDGQGAVPAP